MIYNFYLTDNESDSFIYYNNESDYSPLDKDNYTIKSTLRQFVTKLVLDYFLHRQNAICFNPLYDKIELYDTDNNYMFEIRFFLDNDFDFFYMQWANDLITNNHSVSQYDIEENILAINTLLRDISITRNYYDYDV